MQEDLRCQRHHTKRRLEVAWVRGWRHECVSHSAIISALSPFHEQITINGTVMVFSASAGLQFNGNVTGLALMNGVTYSFSVVARNSVGSSEAFIDTVFVPRE